MLEVLRDYQKKAHEDLRRSIAKGNKAPVMVMPTGSGKTKLSVSIVKSAVEKSKNVLFIAPRRLLVYQTSDELNEFGIEHGVIMSGEPRSFSPRVQVASIDTLHRRSMPMDDVLLIDEAHTVMGDKAKKIFDNYPNAIKIGFTATPARSDGRGLGEVYDDLVLGPSVAELIGRGYLVQPRYFSAPKELNLDAIKMTAGDYNLGQLDEYMRQPQLVGDVVENWQRICPDRSTVVACVKRTHARAVHAEFLRVGVSADYIDGETDNDERKRIFARINSGETRVLVSVDVVSYGVDVPLWSCAVIARPTKSVARFLQFCGRVLRPHAPSGKNDCIIIDHGMCVGDDRLGFIEDDRPWSLDGKSKIQDRTKQKNETKKEPKSMTCPECKHVQKAAPVCANCRADLRGSYAKAVETLQAELEEIARRNSESDKPKMDMAEKQALWSELLCYAARKYPTEERARKWALAKYKSKTGVWPRNLHDEFFEPTPETLNWIRHENIKYAKRKEKEKQQQAAA